MASKNKNSSAIAVFVFCFVLLIILFMFVIITVFGKDSETELQVADYGMQFDEMNVDIEWNDDRTCKITQTIDVRFLTRSHGIYVNIPVNSGEKVRSLDVKTTPSRPYELERAGGNQIIRAVVGDPDTVFNYNDTMQCVVTYEYLTPKHPSDADVLAFNAIGSGWTCLIKHASVTMHYPAAPTDASNDDYGIWIGSEKSNGNDDGVTVDWSEDGKTVNIDISDRFLFRTAGSESSYYALKPFEKVELAYKMPDGVLKTHLDTEFILTLCVGLSLVLLIVLLKLLLAKNKTLTPVVDYYPPRIKGVNGEMRHMLPVQMGKIIDGTCSQQDVTSLIFYWASKGYLAIEEREDDTYLLKRSEISEVTGYEREMFAKLFASGSKGKDGTVEVSLNSLRGKFSNTIVSTKTAVDREYKGKLYKSGFNTLSIVMSVLSVLYGAAFAVLTSLRIGRMIYGIGGVVIAITSLICIIVGFCLQAYSFKFGERKFRIITVVRAVLCVLLAFIAAYTVPKDVMGLAEKLILAICLGIAVFVTPSLIVRTDFYNDQLEHILGFRDFLRDAEKERLETLLKDDPQYYYDILPYANVLGVTDIWEDKFKDLTVEPPSYYSSYRGLTVFDILLLNSLATNINRGLTYVPPSKSSGGSFSGGSFGGGGFSGGSFGGGGGGRW